MIIIKAITKNLALGWLKGLGREISVCGYTLSAGLLSLAVFSTAVAEPSAGTVTIGSLNPVAPLIEYGTTITIDLSNSSPIKFREHNASIFFN